MSDGPVYVRTRKGRYHLASIVDGRRLTDERCQLDDAPGQEEIVSAGELEAADSGSLCGFCFPETQPGDTPGDDPVPE